MQQTPQPQRIHRVQREIYNRVVLPLVKYESYPQQDLRFSQPLLGRMQPGFKDPAVSALPGVYNISERRPFKSRRVQQLSDPEIPGVPGSGQAGKEQKQATMAKMGDANSDPDQLARLQQMLSGGGAGPDVQQKADQQVSIADELNWR